MDTKFTTYNNIETCVNLVWAHIHKYSVTKILLNLRMKIILGIFFVTLFSLKNRIHFWFSQFFFYKNPLYIYVRISFNWFNEHAPKQRTWTYVYIELILILTKIMWLKGLILNQSQNSFVGFYANTFRYQRVDINR